MLEGGATYAAETQVDLRIEVVHEVSALYPLVDQWSVLLLQSGVNRSFSSARWFIESCSAYPGIQPYVFLAYRDERLVGIFPLVWEVQTKTARFVNRLSDYNDLIVEKGDKEVAAALIKKALDTHHPYDQISWIRLRPASNCQMGFRELGMEEQVAPFFIGQSVCPFLKLRGDGIYPESKKFRQHLAWCKRAAARAGIAFEVYDSKCLEARVIIGQFLQLHRARFGQDSPLMEEPHHSFIQSQFPQLLQENKLLLFALINRGEPIAMQLYMQGDQSLCYWNGGWQVEYKGFSPGNLLLYEVIQYAQQKGYEEVDFLRGQEAYKARWTNGERHLGNVVLHLNNGRRPKAEATIPPREHKMTIKTKLVQDSTELETIASDWDRLVSSSSCNRAFSSWIWYRETLAVFPSVHPFVWLAYEGKQLVGICPMVRDEARARISFPNGLSDYNDLILARGRTDIAKLLLLAMEASIPRGFNLVLFFIRPNSICQQVLQTLLPKDQLAQMIEDQRPCPYLELKEDYNFFLQNQKKRFRKHLRSAHRKIKAKQIILQKLDPIEVTGKTVSESFFHLHESRFGPASKLIHGLFRQYLERVIPALFDQGLLHVFALLKNERIIAIDLCTEGDQSLCSWNSGFLPEAAPYSPGRLVISKGIEWAYEMGLKEYDMLRGAEAYKLDWTNQIRYVETLVNPFNKIKKQDEQS
ncbi:MAG: GNAT family N-acetyltransferase [Bacteroidota bacterium]